MWERLSLRSLKDRSNHRVDWVLGWPAEPVRFNNYDIYFSLMLSMQNYILASHLHKRNICKKYLLKNLRVYKFIKIDILQISDTIH